MSALPTCLPAMSAALAALTCSSPPSAITTAMRQEVARRFQLSGVVPYGNTEWRTFNICVDLQPGSFAAALEAAIQSICATRVQARSRFTHLEAEVLPQHPGVLHITFNA